jgi:hypothetical protein
MQGLLHNPMHVHLRISEFSLGVPPCDVLEHAAPARRASHMDTSTDNQEPAPNSRHRAELSTTPEPVAQSA